jgi:hypothetical protein
MKTLPRWRRQDEQGRVFDTGARAKYAILPRRTDAQKRKNEPNTARFRSTSTSMAARPVGITTGAEMKKRTEDFGSARNTPSFRRRTRTQKRKNEPKTKRLLSGAHYSRIVAGPRPTQRNEKLIDRNSRCYCVTRLENGDTGFERRTKSCCPFRALVVRWLLLDLDLRLERCLTPA